MKLFKTAYSSQTGMVPPVLLVVLLVIGLIVGVVVVQQRQTLQSKASQDQVQFTNARVEGDRKIVDSQQVEIQLNAPWAAADLQSPPANKPVSLSATCLPNNQVRLNWEQVNGATSYALRVNNATKSGWNGSCTNPQSAHDFCRDLESNRYFFGYEPGDQYQFWVHANNSHGSSPASDQFTFSCPSVGGGGGSGSGSNGMLGMVLGTATQLLAQYPGALPAGSDEGPYPGSLPTEDPNAGARGDDGSAYPGQLPQGGGDPNADVNLNPSNPAYPGQLPQGGYDPNDDVNLNPQNPAYPGQLPQGGYDPNDGVNLNEPGGNSGSGGGGGIIQAACELIGLCSAEQPAAPSQPSSNPSNNNPGGSSGGGNSGGSNNGGGGGSSQPAVRTTGYRVAEDPTSLQNKPFTPYGKNGLKIVFNFADATNGPKTIFVQFQNSQGGVSDPRSYTVELRTTGGSTGTVTTTTTDSTTGPTAVVSGPTQVRVGEQVTYTINVTSGAFTRGRMWIAKDGGSTPIRVTNLEISGGSAFNCDNAANPNCAWKGLGVSDGTNNFTGQFTPTAAGTYKVIADITDNQGRVCSSNPYVTYNPTYSSGGINFYRCGDPATLVVNP